MVITTACRAAIPGVGDGFPPAMRSAIGFLLALLLMVQAAPGAAQAGANQAAEPAYDVVIRGGRILDGAGNPWIRADVAIAGQRIARIGHIPERGRREIDATGRYVAPGFIDMMDQSGTTVLETGSADTKLLQGVTTLLAGEASAFPVDTHQIGQYLGRLESQGIGINYGGFYFVGIPRVEIIGAVDREATPEELERMRQMVDAAMRSGARGITTALIYPPFSYARTNELIEMARVAARYGGIYTVHIRGEGDELLDALRESITIGREAGIPVEIYHLKAAYRPLWGRLMPQVLPLIEEARAQGVDIAANMYPYTAGATGLEAVIPSWAHEGGTEALKARLRQPDIRARLRREISTGSPGWSNIVEAAGGWDNIILLEAKNPDNARFQGMSINAIARATNRTPEDVAFDIVLQATERTRVLLYLMSEQDIETALRFPWTSIGSDAKAYPATVVSTDGHPRTYGTFPRIIGEYVRRRHVLSLPEAIRKMTSWPATRMRLDDRGVLRAGAWADIVVFDYDTIDGPATYERPTLLPTGIPYVLVNGALAVDDGRLTGIRSGHVLRGAGARASAPGERAEGPGEHDAAGQTASHAH